MKEINGLKERIADLKMQYQEAERLNLKSKAGELLADINYLEELQELRNKQEYVFDKIRAEIEQLPTNYIEIQRPHSVVERDVVELGAVIRIIDKYKAESEVAE